MFWLISLGVLIVVLDWFLLSFGNLLMYETVIFDNLGFNINWLFNSAFFYHILLKFWFKSALLTNCSVSILQNWRFGRVFYDWLTHLTFDKDILVFFTKIAITQKAYFYSIIEFVVQSWIIWSTTTQTEMLKEPYHLFKGKLMPTRKLNKYLLIVIIHLLYLRLVICILKDMRKTFRTEILFTIVLKQ